MSDNEYHSMIEKTDRNYTIYKYDSSLLESNFLKKDNCKTKIRHFLKDRIRNSADFLCLYKMSDMIGIDRKDLIERKNHLFNSLDSDLYDDINDYKRLAKNYGLDWKSILKEEIDKALSSL